MQGCCPLQKGNSVGLDTKGEVTPDFSAWWASETKADLLSLVRANLQEQVKVILHLRQCRIGNASAKDPLLPAFIWHLLCTKDMQASQSYPAAQHRPMTVDVQRVAKHLFLWSGSCHKSQ